MNRLKKWIRENVVECIGIIGGTIAIAIIIVFGFILIDDRDKPESQTSEKSAAASITAGLQQQIEKDTTTKDSNTNTSLETSEEKTKEKEGTSLEDESTTLDDSVKNSESIVQPATRQPQTKVVNNQTTKANSQQQTTKQPQITQASTTKPTVTAPVRGKNGVILEKLCMVRYKNYDLDLETVEIPENNKQLIEKTRDDGEGNGIGYQIYYNSLIVKKYKANIFNNDIYIGKTKQKDIKQIYGEPYKKTILTESNGNYVYRYTYRYGKGINSLKDDIYISFDFSVYSSKPGEEVLNFILIGNGTLMFE